jgi:hypothetical protein
MPHLHSVQQGSSSVHRGPLATPQLHEETTAYGLVRHITSLVLIDASTLTPSAKSRVTFSDGGISEKGWSKNVTRDFAEGVNVEASMSTSEVMCRTKP